MEILLQGGAALRLLRRRRDGRFALARRGAVLLGVPGLPGMIRHHAVFYRDLADPVGLLRDAPQTELARFWPYVFGAAGPIDPAVAATYSGLMADTQALVAEDTLRLVDLSGVRRLMDVGGGTGAFLAAAMRRHPAMRGVLFDLPAVVPGARARFAAAGLADRAEIRPGSFRDGGLPAGADAISLVRVLYDHADDTVSALLAAVHAALPAGGRLIVSEPMSGGARPDPITDTYFAFYTLAMGTGCTRPARRIGAMLAAAGFVRIRVQPGPRPYVTSVVTATATGAAASPA
jgi:demethylspheroidene O-methyltransferase